MPITFENEGYAIGAGRFSKKVYILNKITREKSFPSSGVFDAFIKILREIDTRTLSGLDRTATISYAFDRLIASAENPDSLAASMLTSQSPARFVDSATAALQPAVTNTNTPPEYQQVFESIFYTLDIYDDGLLRVYSKADATRRFAPDELQQPFYQILSAINSIPISNAETRGLTFNLLCKSLCMACFGNDDMQRYFLDAKPEATAFILQKEARKIAVNGCG